MANSDYLIEFIEIYEAIFAQNVMNRHYTKHIRGKFGLGRVQTQEIHEFLKQKREFQKTQDFRDLYRQRSSVEGTISQAAWVLGMRRSRYRGIEKTHLQNILTATAINLTRAVNWLTNQPLDETRTSRFAALVA